MRGEEVEHSRPRLWLIIYIFHTRGRVCYIIYARGLIIYIFHTRGRVCYIIYARGRTQEKRAIAARKRTLLVQKRTVLNKMRALMDKNGVVMERFETFRVWEFICGCPAEGGTSSAAKSAEAKMFRIVPLSGFRESCKVFEDKD
jgi:hypothetical protein